VYKSPKCRDFVGYGDADPIQRLSLGARRRDGWLKPGWSIEPRPAERLARWAKEKKRKQQPNLEVLTTLVAN